MMHFSVRWFLLFDFMEKGRHAYLGLTEEERIHYIDFLCDKIMERANNA